MFEIRSANFIDSSMKFTSLGDDSECSVAVVPSGALAVDVRMQLRSEHLRIFCCAASTSA
jgi:hypothetical protein